VIFFVGLHQPSDAKHVERAFISANRVLRRRKPVEAKEWILDSGAFTALAAHGRYLASERDYADLVRRFGDHGGGLVAAVSQDYMCEPFMLAKTECTVIEHQRMTIERYDAILSHDLGGVYLMPVLQGYAPSDYAAHVHMYGDRLGPRAWVGVGSVCKRNGRPQAIAAVLRAILAERPDLRLHGFGVKTTALGEACVRDRLFSADSMAWSFAARRQGEGRNNWRLAKRFADRIAGQAVQTDLFP
jgi:hypothetical protein